MANYRPDDPDGTRTRLAEIERQLGEDPGNEELQAQVFRLKNVLASFEWLALARQRAAIGRWLLWAWEHRN